jgi:hypothetical protein
MGNVLSKQKREQVISLGRLGWPLRRIEEATGVRRETAPCKVTAITAPESISTACSALWARCVLPFFIFATRASSSMGLLHSLFDVRFLRLRSSRAKSSRVGVSMPEA